MLFRPRKSPLFGTPWLFKVISWRKMYPLGLNVEITWFSLPFSSSKQDNSLPLMKRTLSSCHLSSLINRVLHIITVTPKAKNKRSKKNRGKSHLKHKPVALQAVLSKKENSILKQLTERSLSLSLQSPIFYLLNSRNYQTISTIHDHLTVCSIQIQCNKFTASHSIIDFWRYSLHQLPHFVIKFVIVFLLRNIVLFSLDCSCEHFGSGSLPSQSYHPVPSQSYHPVHHRLS